MEINSTYAQTLISPKDIGHSGEQREKPNQPESQAPNQEAKANNRVAVAQANLLNSSTLFAAQEIGQAQKTEATKNETKQDGELSKEEKAAVRALQARDAEVKAHERAHASRGGQYTGQPKLTYETGPDGRRYAVAGEVSIDASPVNGNPEATIEKLRVVKAAALAPAEPSAQDRKVAAIAEAGIRQAQGELRAEKAEELKETMSGGKNENSNRDGDLTPAMAKLVG